MRRFSWILSTLLLLVGYCGDKQEQSMSITVNLRYTGTDGNARKFAEEMISRDHKRFGEDITQAVERLEQKL